MTPLDHDLNDTPPLQEVFVPVHGAIYLYPEELAIVDHPAFQRLKRMRQLGLAHHVFPGANHTRFEHSLGALHVSQVIVDSVKRSFVKRQGEDANDRLKIETIDYATARFIRLGALLHDLGHLPLGHTFEDELGHLPKHDDRVRLRDVAQRRYPHYVLRHSKYSAGPAWASLSGHKAECTLEELVNALYAPIRDRLGLALEPFEIFLAIVCKPPKPKSDAKTPGGDGSPDEDGEAAKAKADKDKEDEDREHKLVEQCSGTFKLSVCRDIVGNTICADLLDYLVRDWFHIGKAFHLDDRIFQLMEVRNAKGAPATDAKFVINGGKEEKIYYDAFTNVLDLLESRYKLTETVIFNRTKVSLNAILDRSLLEIRDIWSRAGLAEDAFQAQAVADLLDASDEAVPDLLKAWLDGGSDLKNRKAVAKRKSEDRAALEAASNGQLSLMRTAEPERQDQFTMARTLVDRLRDRQNYKLVFKLPRAKFAALETRHQAFIDLYKLYGKRLDYLRGVESLCGLPEGSLVSYFPPSRAMNAKVAEVNLLLDDRIVPFATYETDNEGEPTKSLTSGTLTAQVERFKHLWSFQVFMERGAYEELTPPQRLALTRILRDVLFNMDGKSRDDDLERQALQPFVEVVHPRRAARAGSTHPPPTVPDGFVFPGGIPYGGGQ